MNLRFGGRRPVAAGLVRRAARSQLGMLYIVALLLGLLVGVAVLVFRAAIEWVHDLVTHTLIAGALEPVLGPWAVVAALAGVGALVGLLMSRLVGHEKHHGAASVIESVAQHGGRLPYRKMPAKAIASALSIGGGAAVGPEDPSVQIGSNIGSWLGDIFRLTRPQARLLVAAGGAAAIAAAFQAPIAGVFFALEVILNGTYETRSFGGVVLAAVVASGVVQAIAPGREIGPFAYALRSPLEMVLFIPLGALLALVSVAYIRLVSWQQQIWGAFERIPRALRTALAGALVGMVAIALPEIMGTGQETMNAVLGSRADMTVLALLALGVAKLVMNAVSLAGGFVGGVFAPSLFIGIMFGSAYGQVIAQLLPATPVSNAAAYAVAGMAAMLTGVVRAPLTAIMIVFELTNDYRLILPIMLTTVICNVVAERFEPDGLYMRALKRKGFALPQGREIDLMQVVRVEEVMRVPAPSIAEDAALTDLRDALRAQRARILCVMKPDGSMIGVVSLSDLQRAYTEDGADLTVSAICTRQVIMINPQDSLSDALQHMDGANVPAMPVVEPLSGSVVGLFERKSVIKAYAVARTRRSARQR